MAKKNHADNISASQKQRESERNYLYWITRLYVLFILAVFPLYVGSQGYDNIVFSKAQFFWVTSIIFLVAFALFYTVYRLGLKTGEKPEIFHKTMSVVDWCVLAFMLFITISFLLSEYKNIAFIGTANRNDGWLTYILMLTAYFPLSRWYKPREADFNLFAISALLVCLIGFLQFYFYDFLNLFPYTRDRYSDAEGNPLHSGFSITFRSTLGNNNFMSPYIAIIILAFALLYIKSGKKIRFLYFGTSTAAFWMMTVGASDSATVAVLGSFVLLLPYFVEKKETFGKTLFIVASYGVIYCTHHWWMLKVIMPSWPETAPLGDLGMRDAYDTLPLAPIFVLSVVIALMGIAAIFVKRIPWPGKKAARISALALIAAMGITGIIGIELFGENTIQSGPIYQAREILHGNINDHTASNRGYVWKAALSAFPEHPLFGTGSDTFMQALGEERRDFNGERFDKAHNDFLQILVCNGIFALAAYLAALVALCLKSYNRAFNDLYLLAALGSALSYLIQSFFGIDTVTVTPIFWLMLAVAESRCKSDGNTASLLPESVH